MADWIRRSFTSAGLTQIPPGRHIGALQGRYGGGVVMLCIDVSGSMDGNPIREAVRGAKKLLGRTNGAAGGNDLIGPLNDCHKVLDRFKDAPDRVVALFGDGDLTP